MRAGRGDWVTKIGAEGVQAIGIRSRGWGIAVKVADGAKRGLHPATVAVLDQLGLLDADAARGAGAVARAARSATTAASSPARCGRAVVLGQSRRAGGPPLGADTARVDVNLPAAPSGLCTASVRRGAFPAPRPTGRVAAVPAGAAPAVRRA